MGVILIVIHTTFRPSVYSSVGLFQLVPTLKHNSQSANITSGHVTATPLGDI